jgi:hypothetical protein
VAVDVHQLADRQAVVDVCVNYGLALDSRDWARLRDCFTADAVADYSGTVNDGYAAIEAACRAALEPLNASQHLLGNHLVTLDPANEDAATSVCYFQAQHVKEGLSGGSHFVVAGRYDDRLIRTDGGWRIQHRTLTIMWTSGNSDILPA